MTDETAAPAGGDDIAVIEDTGGELSIDDAASLVVNERKKPPAERAQPATADNELSEEGNADPETDPGETQEADAEKEPPIARPKSWSKDEDAEWQSLPRAMQQKIVARELERDNGTTRSQQEAANARKAFEAEQAKAEQARQQYEERAKSALKILEREQLRDFPDIRSVEDLANMAREAQRLWAIDPLQAGQIQARLTAWNVHQQELAAAHAAVQEANNRQATEQQTSWTQHVQKENALAAEVIPDLADKEKGPALQKRAAERLGNLGFSQEELNDLASGKQKLSIYDHRIQQLIFSDLKLSDIQSAKTAAAAKPLPPVQRPGSAQPRGAARDQNLQALSRKLDSSGDIEDAFEMLTAQRRAS